MKRKELREVLDLVHKELGQTNSVDQESEKILRDILKDIQVLVESTEKTKESDSLNDRLEKVLNHFESEHMDLTISLSRMINLLSEMGI